MRHIDLFTYSANCTYFELFVSIIYHELNRAEFSSSICTQCRYAGDYTELDLTVTYWLARPDTTQQQIAMNVDRPAPA